MTDDEDLGFSMLDDDSSAGLLRPCSALVGNLLLDDGCVFTLLEQEAAAESGLTDEEENLDFSTLEEDLSDFTEELDDSGFSITAS